MYNKINKKIVMILTIAISAMSIGCNATNNEKNNQLQEQLSEEVAEFQQNSEDENTSENKDKTTSIASLQYDHSMDLQYAKNFQVDYYQEDIALITIVDGSRYLVLPEDVILEDTKNLPKMISESVKEKNTDNETNISETNNQLQNDIAILHKPVTNIYLAATAAMSLFDALDGLDYITLSGTKEDGWYIPNARKAMEEGRIQYAGKYSTPDYELLATSSCELAIESTMINHTPEVKEQLQNIGIPVLTEFSSYEEHPLGRTEWIKLYGVLLGEEDMADEIFNEQVQFLNEATEIVSSQLDTLNQQTVAFFYISSNGYAVTRKSGDYIPKMISLAGGKYIFDSLSGDENATSTVKLEMEQFYATAKDADVIIYNGTIDGGVKSINELIAMNSILADFNAVQNGNVWCTNNNFYQETIGLGEATKEINELLYNEQECDENLKYFIKLK